MLVVNPNNRLKTTLAAIEPPLWAGLIENYHNTDILDAEAEGLSLAETETRIRASGHKDVLIVVMGNNPAVSSTTKANIAEGLAWSLPDLDVSLTGIHPIAAGGAYTVIKQPFEGFPSMPFDKLPMEKYRAHNWHCLDGSPRSPYASVYTSLGCPYSCYYCPIHTLYGDRQVKFRPIRDIFREIDFLVTRYNVRNIKFWDELFALKEDRVTAICSGLKDYELNIWAYARLDSVTPKMLEAMKQAGINWLAYGFETISDRKFILQTEEVIKMTEAAGISIIANFMFGLPETTRDDDRRSVEFAIKHLFEFVNFYDAKPYPGSKWFEDTKPGTGWEAYSQYGNQSEFRKQAFQDYFANPDYLVKIVKKFGKQAKGQIEDMLRDRFNE